LAPVLMWDWEIASYLRGEGLNILAPYSLEQTRKACRALGVKRELKHTKFLVFQDNPGPGSRPASSSGSIGGKMNAPSA
jgi:hypothetical protein